MDLGGWLREKGRIAHRADAMDAGFSVHRIRSAIRNREVERIRSSWISLPDAPADLRTAAASGGRLTCVTLARHRGWWVPPDTGPGAHVHLDPHAASPDDGVVAHWSQALSPAHPRSLVTSVPDALADVARCFTLDQAVAVWESAVRIEDISLESLREVRWPSTLARRCADHVRPGTDSSLETIVHVRLSPWGVRLRMQVRLAGHDVDFLIGTHLIMQIDGWGFHSSSADRTRDIAHDAELRLRGYTVLRFSYQQVMHRWPDVERILSGALSRGLHMAPRR